MLSNRTPEEQEVFDVALRSMQVFYAHQKLFALLLTTVPEGCDTRSYDERGWVRSSNPIRVVAGPPRIRKLWRFTLPPSPSVASHLDVVRSGLTFADHGRACVDDDRQEQQHWLCARPPD